MPSIRECSPKTSYARLRVGNGDDNVVHAIDPPNEYETPIFLECSHNLDHLVARSRSSADQFISIERLIYAFATDMIAQVVDRG